VNHRASLYMVAKRKNVAMPGIRAQSSTYSLVITSNELSSSLSKVMQDEQIIRMTSKKREIVEVS